MLHGNKLYRRAPVVSHLLFANDSFLFFNATPDDCRIVKGILQTYEAASGQTINLSRSGIFFSNNVTDELHVAMTSILEVVGQLNTRKYLRLLSLVGRGKKVIFAHLRDDMELDSVLEDQTTF